jgi:hypothetical protein
LKIYLELGDRDLTKKNEGNRSRNGFFGGDISFIIYSKRAFQEGERGLSLMPLLVF